MIAILAALACAGAISALVIGRDVWRARSIPALAAVHIAMSLALMGVALSAALDGARKWVAYELAIVFLSGAGLRRAAARRAARTVRDFPYTPPD